MLVSRHRHRDHDYWPLSKCEPPSLSSLNQRMSDPYFKPVPPYPECRQNTSLSRHHVAVKSLPLSSSSCATSGERQTKSAMEDQSMVFSRVPIKEEREPQGYYQLPESLGLAQHAQEAASGSVHHGPLSPGQNLASTQVMTRGGHYSSMAASRAEEHSNRWTNQIDPGAPDEPESVAKEEEEEEDAVEDEEDDDDDDPDQSSLPQTAAERSAAKRKMKRFRLTHQQTRFLMTEFVKQPHPDASHRERLSREIPGLSPRQVQVWFQNRRAKIKRLTAEDRGRMMMMRAVPENFDNIQALHSPYGAVHGLGSLLASPPDIGGSAFDERLKTSLLVDVRRPENDGNLSPTGLTPAFENTGIGSSMTANSEMHSPLSAPLDNRQPYSSQFSSSGLGSRTPSTYPGGSERYYDGPSTIIQPAGRPPQSLSFRDPFSRSHIDMTHGSLRSSFSWKGEVELPGMGDHRASGNQTIDAGLFDTDSFPGHSISSTMGRDITGLQQAGPSRSRLRACSATIPLNVDVRFPYLSADQSRSPKPSISENDADSSQYTTRSSIYTTSYPPAPLTAPISIPPPREGIQSRGGLTSAPGDHMSAPASATGDFSATLRDSKTPQSSSQDAAGSSVSGIAHLYGSNFER